MAMPIKETPILKGKEAKEFLNRINTNKNRPVSREAYEKAEKAYKDMQKNGTGFGF